MLMDVSRLRYSLRDSDEVVFLGEDGAVEKAGVSTCGRDIQRDREMNKSRH